MTNQKGNETRVDFMLERLKINFFLRLKKWLVYSDSWYNKTEI